MTELACRWWMVPAGAGSRLTSALEHAFALGTVPRVAIREPEVWGPAARWP
ncbi:hypothetical protein [Dactylosporangium cerinum]